MLEHTDDDTAALVDLLRTSRRGPLRLEAVRRLAAMERADLAPVLLETLNEAENPNSLPVVVAALQGLRALGHTIAPQLLEILDGAPDSRRQFMPLLLASALNEAAVPRLIEALDDPDTTVAVNAATQLGQLAHAEAFEPLAAVATNATARLAVRGAALAALGALRDIRALPLLVEFSASGVPDLLGGAIDGLADLRAAAGVPHLEAVLERPEIDKATERAVRLALLAMERYRLDATRG